MLLIDQTDVLLIGSCQEGGIVVGRSKECVVSTSRGCVVEQSSRSARHITPLVLY